MDDSRLIKLAVGIALFIFLVAIVLFGKLVGFADEPPKIFSKPSVQVFAIFLALMLILGLGMLVYSAFKGFQ